MCSKEIIMKYKIWFCIIIIFCFIFWKFFFFHQKCYENITTQVVWKSMEPFFKDGENLQVKQNYYNCHTIQRDDFVIVDTHSNYWQIIKQVKAIPGDKIIINVDTGNIFINDTKLISPYWDYIFTKPELEMMNLYVKDNLLIENAYFVFGTLQKNSIDSRKLWWIDRKNIIWKIDF